MLEDIARHREQQWKRFDFSSNEPLVPVAESANIGER
jgi:hypothetical protein